MCTGNTARSPATAIAALESEIAEQLRALRAQAVAQRVKEDPERARWEIDGFGKPRRGIKYNPTMWLGMEHRAYAAIDDRVERELRGLLSGAQFESLPSRKSARNPGDGKKDVKEDGKAGSGKGRKKAGGKPAGK